MAGLFTRYYPTRTLLSRRSRRGKPAQRVLRLRYSFRSLSCSRLCSFSATETHCRLCEMDARRVEESWPRLIASKARVEKHPCRVHPLSALSAILAERVAYDHVSLPGYVNSVGVQSISLNPLAAAAASHSR